MSDPLTHFDEQGASRMVDVGGKDATQRRAVASCRIRMRPETAERIRTGNATSKGNVLEVARLAGIMAAKRTADLIPLCHTLSLESVAVEFELAGPDFVVIRTEVKTTASTGVEMEALAAASITALTIYDMCKSIDRGMVVERLQLEEKSGGRSGHFVRKD